MTDKDQEVMPDVDVQHDEKDRPEETSKRAAFKRFLMFSLVVSTILLLLLLLFKFVIQPDKSIENDEANNSESEQKSELSDTIASLTSSENRSFIHARSAVDEKPDQLDESNSDISERAMNQTLMNIKARIEELQSKFVERDKAKVKALAELRQSQHQFDNQLKMILGSLNRLTSDINQRMELTEGIDRKIGHVQNSIYDLGGKVVEKEESFNLMVWGVSTYAGERLVSVSTKSEPENFTDMSVGQVRGGWKLRDIRNGVAIFSNAAGDKKEVPL